MLLQPSKELVRFAIAGAFSTDEVDKIRFFEKIIPFRTEDDIFCCNIGEVEADMNTENVLYNKLQHVLSVTNYESFMYNIDTMEKITYVHLTDKNENHIKAHRETLLEGYRKSDRKITLIAMLSNDNEYQGGEIKIDVRGNLEPETISLKIGEVVFFDSHITWKVDPVTSGEMRLLVTNAWGPSAQ